MQITQAFSLKKYHWLFWGLAIIVIIIPRILDLDVFYARDELTIWPWIDQFALAIFRGDWAGTLTESDYPGIPMFWAQTLFLTFKYNFPTLFAHPLLSLEMLTSDRSLALLAERRLVVGLLVSGQIMGAVWLVKRLLGWPVALLSGIFMALDPFSLTEARVLRLEMVSAYFVCLSLLAYFLYWQTSRRKWLILSGVMAGLGVSSKTSAGLLVPYIWFLLILGLWLDRDHPWPERLRRGISDGLGWAGSAIAAFWLVWPALWVNPVQALSHVFLLGLSQAATESVWHGDVFFWGQLIPNDPGPFFYPVVFAFRTTWLTWLGLAAALGLVVKSFPKIPWSKLLSSPQNTPSPSPSPESGEGVGRGWPVFTTILLLSYLIIIVLELTLVISKVDRFLLLIFPALNLITALGLWALIQKFFGFARPALRGPVSPPGQQRGREVGNPLGAFDSEAGWVAVAIGLILLLQLTITIPVHPHYFTYWNPLVGGGAVAAKTLPIGSGEGIAEAVAYLNDQPAAAHTSLICGASQPWCAGQFVGETLRSALYDSGEWVTADYASFYISHLQRQTYPPEVVNFFAAQTPVKAVKLQGVDYMQVYAVPQIDHFAGAWNDLAGLGQLLGYSFANPIAGGTTAKVGEAIEVKVWWTNLGAGVREGNLVLRWLDARGYEWGRTPLTPLPEYASTPVTARAIVVGTATLPIPPATPPDLYFLRIGVVSPADGRLLGEFTMPDTADKVVVTPGQPLTDPSALTIDQLVNEPLAAEISLLGYALPDPTLTQRAETPTWLTLYWQATTQPPDYEVQLHLLNDMGQTVAQWQGRPGQNRYPTNTWQAGEIVRDVWALQVTPDLPIATYRLAVSLCRIEDTTHRSDLDRRGLDLDRRGLQDLCGLTFLIPNLEVWPQAISYDMPEMHTEVGINFGDRLTLLGYDLYLDTAGTGQGQLAPTFYWQSQTVLEGGFDLLLTLRRADTAQVVQEWRVPLGGEGPKRLWKADEIINTSYQLAVAAPLNERYHLDIALQNLTTNKLEPISGGNTDFVRLENIQDKIIVRVNP